jgi:hypothetical protein
MERCPICYQKSPDCTCGLLAELGFGKERDRDTGMRSSLLPNSPQKTFKLGKAAKEDRGYGRDMRKA